MSLKIKENTPLSAPIKNDSLCLITICLFSGVSSESTHII